MSDDNIIQFPGIPDDGDALKPVEQHGTPLSPEAYEDLEEIGRRTFTITEEQAKALRMILGDHAFVCISMSPNGTGSGADVRTVVGGDHAIIREFEDRSHGGLHGVLSRLLIREELGGDQ